ncbi:helix-turn-helix domain-containing protein [Gilvibacter sp. SZ-19]|uniref:helix-turn-helix domain-containing protein n=1 Tax=Gilvibacter sp. SZ-19 TaxID=754429 RepID=UPI003516730F
MAKPKLVTAGEASLILGCSRSQVERLQIKGELKPVPTIHARFYFRESDVLTLKAKLNAKSGRS